MKKRISYLLVILLSYAVIYFICNQFLFHLYTPDWTANNILWIAAIISAAPAFWEYYHFPYITLSGYILGVVFGEMFGRTMKVMDKRLPPMPYHYGWWICIMLYLFACLVGVTVEIILKKKRSRSNDRK